MNLSNKILTQDHLSLLRKGLSFIPTPKLPNHIHSLRDTLLFTRRLRLNEFFERNPIPRILDNPLDHPSYPKKERSFNPNKGPNLQLEKFIADIEESATNFLPRVNCHSNLTDSEWKALKDIRNDKSIILKPADKGGAMVILNTDEYINKCMAHLNDNTIYEPLPCDRTQEVNNEIKNFISRRRNISLPDDAHLRLVPKYPRTAEFYILPKIHKPGVPGRPIVSANECPTEIISKIVDAALKPIAMNTPSYIKDTKDFLCLLKDIGRLEKDEIMMTLDVSSLYTSIPHKDGINAAKEMLYLRTDKKPPDFVLTQFMVYILTRNVFHFNNKYYRQIQGTAMGTRMAPSYAIIFMHDMESKLLRRTSFNIKIWKRYIDDIFAIAKMKEADFQTFIQEINSFHETIKYTGEASRDLINFLDVQIYTDSEGFIHTRPYSKPTDAHIYLDFGSYHPNKQKESIPFSQAVRLRRICSDIHDFDTATKQMAGFFTNRGYPYRLLTDAIRKARHLDRDELLKNNARNTGTIIPYIIEFNHHNAFLATRYQKFKKKTREPGKQFTDNTMITYKRSRNLKDILVRSRYPSTTPTPGCSPCGHCDICKHVLRTNSITSYYNKYRHQIKSQINCQSVNLIYLISCTKCKKQYVGQTSNSLGRRFREHLNTIRRREDVSLSEHYHALPHSLDDLNIVGLETNARPLTTRLKLETSYIRILDTVFPHGLNGKL